MIITMNQELLDELVPFITNRTKAFHTMFSLPLIAEQWEETLHRAFKDIGKNTRIY